MGSILRGALMGSVGVMAVTRGLPTVALRRGAGAAPPPPAIDTRLKTFFTADIDPAHERDDEAMMAIAYASQDKIEIVGQVADAPDGNVSGYTPLINAYEADYAILSTHGSAGQFKSAAALTAMTVQGAATDAPSRGYWISGDAGYAAAHSAAQSLIAAAQTHGDPSGTLLTNPKGKLWVIGGGGAVTMRQALYEAVDLGQLPDFCDRVVWLWQSKHNSYHTRNAVNGIFAGHWQAAGVPGPYGNLTIINPAWQAHALASEGSATPIAVWNEVITRGAMGAALETERAASDYTASYFRAMDAWLLWWLLLAEARNNYDPTVATDMPAGTLQLRSSGSPYPWNDGVPTWGPSNTNGGWPTSSLITYPDTPYSPRHYTPASSISSKAAAEALVDRTSWYTLVRRTMARYAVAAGDPSRSHRVAEWKFDEGSGQTVNNTGPKTISAGTLGLDGTVSADDPTWTTSGLSMAAGDYVNIPADTDLDGIDFVYAWVVKFDSILTSANQTISDRDNGTTTRQHQLRLVNGAPNFLHRYGAGTSNVAAQSPTVLSPNTWYLIVARVGEDKKLTLRVNEATVATTAAMSGVPNNGNGVALRIGGRGASDPMLGTIAYGAVYNGPITADVIPDIEARAKAVVAAKGISFG